MKSRKSLNHTSVVTEVIELCKEKFLPSVGVIKECIEMLIERGYIERSVEERDLYIYVS